MFTVVISSPSLSNSVAADEEEHVELDDTKLTRLTLKGLTPQQTYRLTLCVRNGVHTGLPSHVDIKTLPDGREIPLFPMFFLYGFSVARFISKRNEY